MEKMTVVEATTSDASLIAEILTDATNYKVVQSDFVWGAQRWGGREVRDFMLRSTVYLVFMGDVVVGTVSLQWEDIRTWGSDAVEAGYMHKLAIKNGLRGLGVGERVIEWVKRTVTDSGRDTLRLDCEDANSKLCSYYEKLGFIKAGTKSILEGDGYVAALCEMRLSSKDKPNR